VPGRTQTLLSAAAIALLAAAALAQDRAADDAADEPRDRPRVAIQTNKGRIVVELFPDQAPRTVENFLRYADEGFYDDTIFHRVEPGFVIQGGGLTPELEIKPVRDPIDIESSSKRLNERGTVAMAREGDPNSATSQFFINVSDNPQLDRKAGSFGYAVFGKVIEGMDVVDRIALAQTTRRGPLEHVPILPVIIESIRRVEEP